MLISGCTPRARFVLCAQAIPVKAKRPSTKAKHEMTLAKPILKCISRLSHFLTEETSIAIHCPFQITMMGELQENIQQSCFQRGDVKPFLDKQAVSSLLEIRFADTLLSDVGTSPIFKKKRDVSNTKCHSITTLSCIKKLWLFP